MVELNATVLAPAITCVVAIICTSAIWIGAYYIGVKDNSEVVYLPATSPPVVLTSPGPQVPCLGSCE
ncbi:hypothetical protein Tcan_08706 [Toxocara canis]|uniref:Transmembrane protein n=1 Tax=Toxocara canis TaxID=6265 RepID=A0A0B2V953_TOXCA|nr:hypothetical protein Tcan_08706 [Toxocara canis]